MTALDIWKLIGAVVVAAAAAFGLATSHYESRIDSLAETLRTKDFPPPRIVDRWHTTTIRVSDPAQTAKVDDLTKRLARARNRLAELESRNESLSRESAHARRTRQMSNYLAQSRRVPPAPVQYLSPERQLMEAADRDGVYQNGSRVASASGIFPDLRNGVVRFGEITGNGSLNPGADFQFRNLTLHVAGHTGGPGAPVVGITQADVWENVVCRIVRAANTKE